MDRFNGKIQSIFSCRSLPGQSEYADGKPFCFYEGSVNTPESEWRWEECDIAVCGVNCSLPSSTSSSTSSSTLPACEEYVEPDPGRNIQIFSQVFSTISQSCRQWWLWCPGEVLEWGTVSTPSTLSSCSAPAELMVSCWVWTRWWQWLHSSWGECLVTVLHQFLTAVLESCGQDTLR